MSLFKIFRGDSARISTETTPFHDGYAYFTANDGGFYIDADHGGKQERICINPKSRTVVTTLLASAWVNGRQTIAINGLGANQNGVIGVAQNITEEQIAATRSADLYACAQSDGALTVAADGEIPKCDIPVVIILFA